MFNSIEVWLKLNLNATSELSFTETLLISLSRFTGLTPLTDQRSIFLLYLLKK